MGDYLPIGAEAKVYRNTGTFGSPIWTECPNLSDIETGPLSPDLVAVIARGMGRRKAYVPGMKDQKIKGKLLWRKNDDHELMADVQAFLDAGQNGTPLELLALDGDIDTAGNEGLRMTCHIKLDPRVESNEEHLTVGFEASQALTDNATSWYVCS